MIKKTVTIRLTDAAHKRIKELAARENRTVSAQLEVLIKKAS